MSNPQRLAPEEPRDNPFLRRVTERLRDDEAFLEIVSPEPLSTFLGEHGRSGALYDVLAVIAGTPGSGKTTLARLFHFPTVVTLLRNASFASRRHLLAALSYCGAIRDEIPQLITARLPMESDYRDTWEFPYPEDLRLSLLTALIQARAVLDWIRNLRAAGIEEDEIEFVPREDAHAALETIGGTGGRAVAERARNVELALYSIAGALVPPRLGDLPPAATGAYRPIDVIELVRARIDIGGVPRVLSLRPLLVLDDAHALHPNQFTGVKRWLARRELRIARWMLTRLDILTPPEVLKPTDQPGVEGPLPGLMGRRDFLAISLQSGIRERRGNRAAFRQMARDMAGRYLRRMPVFAHKGLQHLEDFLITDEPTLPAGKLADVQKWTEIAQERLNIAPTRRDKLLEEIDRYAESARSVGLTAELRFAMLRILMHRYANRVPQKGLFGAGGDPEPSRPISASKSVFDGARIQLLHLVDRPYYFGIDDLADASSENAEQFLQLAFQLVDTAETQLTRGRPASLDPRAQHVQMRDRARDLLQQWSFPHHQRVRQLAAWIADRCKEISLRPNAPLDAGANAYGIRSEEFDRIPIDHPALARVLQFGISYNAITLVPNYECKQENWTL